MIKRLLFAATVASASGCSAPIAPLTTLPDITGAVLTVTAAAPRHLPYFLIGFRVADSVVLTVSDTTQVYQLPLDGQLRRSAVGMITVGDSVDIWTESPGVAKYSDPATVHALQIVVRQRAV